MKMDYRKVFMGIFLMLSTSACTDEMPSVQTLGKSKDGGDAPGFSGHSEAQKNMGPTTEGDYTMTPNELVEALRRIDGNDENALELLSRNVAEQAFAPIRAVTTLLNDQDSNIKHKAATVISNVGDLAILPLLESPEPKDVRYKLWLLNTVIDSHLAVQDKIVARLDSMLTDKTLIKWGKGDRPVEQKHRPSRVCDEAYILMRGLLNAKEGTMESIHQRDAFLALSDQVKDTEILKARESRAWGNLLGEEE